MRRILIFLLALIAVILAALVLAPAFLPAETYREQVQSSAREALGREIMLEGDISLSLLPSARVSARDVRIANAEGFGDEAFAEMGELRVKVGLIPLLFQRVEIEEFRLIDPVIRLSQSGGRNNWSFGEAPAPAPSSGEGWRRPGALPFEASFGDVGIENATILYSDGAQTRRIEGLNLDLTLPSVDQEAVISGAFIADGEALSFDGRIGSLRDLFEGEETPVEMRFGGDLVSASVSGAVQEGAELAFEGEFNADIPSMRALAAFAGTELPPGEGFGRFAVERGALLIVPGVIGLTSQDIRFDALRAGAALALDLDRERPRLRGRLTALNTLDFNPYMPDLAPAGDAAPAEPVARPWSEDPLALDALGLIDADLEISAPGLRAAGLEMGEIAMTLAMENSRLQADLTEISLYGGSGTGRLVVNGRGAGSYRLIADLDNVEALDLLRDAAGFERLQGRGAVTLDLRAGGASQAAIMNSLTGQGGFAFEDGAIIGVNIARLIRTIELTVSGDEAPQGFGDQQTTDFSALTGSFSVENGLARNSDFLLLSPLLRVTGEGQVNLAAQTLDYRLRPRAVASVQGQGGERDLQGLTVPVRLRGPFHDISYGVDSEAVGQALLRGLVTGGQEGEDLEDRARGALRNALGLGGERNPDDAAPEGESEQRDPAETLLRDLFGLGGQRSPEPEPNAEPEPEPEDPPR